MNERIKLHVILVGSNPLPCYIQAAYALEEGEGLGKRPDKILFVVTSDSGSMANGTRKFAKNIQEILENHYGCNKDLFDYLELNNGYDSEEIEGRVAEEISKINEKTQIEEIFLNNTGGTKAMAVYATMAIRGLPFYNSIFVTECYVDSQENKLRCRKQRRRDEEVNRVVMLPEKGDLREIIKLTIGDLVFLHYGNNKLKCSDLDGETCSWDIKVPEAILTEKQFQLAKKLLINDNATIWSTYEEFYNNCPSTCKSTKTKEAKKIKELKKALNKFEDTFIDKINTLFEIPQNKNLKEDEESLKMLLPFASGEWLECYFYMAILNAKEKLEKKGIEIRTVWSCEVTPTDKNGAEDNKSFEVDVLVLRGYEMTLFSISMAEKAALAKGKWFEAVYRTEQMAGEHGGVAIVNLMDTADNQNSYIEKFKKDLENFNRDVELFNRKDLKDYDALVEKLTEKFS